MENLNNQQMDTQIRKTRHAYRPSEVLRMKELIRTGFKVKEIAAAYHQEFGVPIGSFTHKLYSLAKSTRKKKKPVDKQSKTFVQTMIHGRKTRTFRQPFGSIDNFMTENSYVASKDKTVKLKNLHYMYILYCINRKERPLTLKNFKSWLINSGITVTYHVGYMRAFVEKTAQSSTKPEIAPVEKKQEPFKVETLVQGEMMKRVPKNIEILEDRIIIHL